MAALTSTPATQKSNLCSTGIEGLDDILRGGLPRAHIYLCTGVPGVGKTTLALQFLLEGAKHGEKCLFISLSETQSEIMEIAQAHRWPVETLSILEFSAIQEKISNDTQNTLFPVSEIELNQTMKVLMDKVQQVNPTCVVLDSLSEIRLLAQEPLRYRREMLALKQFFSKRSCTVILLDDGTGGGDEQIQSIAHGVISLEIAAPEYGIDRRRLKIVKLRGVPFRGGYHDYIIRVGGLQVFPRLIAAEHGANFLNQNVSSNIPELDQLTGGGITRGTTALILGPAGTGKSTLATQYLAAAAEKGENVLAILFDETVSIYLQRTRSIGLDLEPHVKNGRIKFVHVDPAELSPGEIVHLIRTEVEKNKCRIVVLDSMNGYMNALPEERFLNLHLHELSTYLNNLGIVTLMVFAQHGIMGEVKSQADLSYLADMVILLRYFEFQGQIKKAISILKKRTGKHETSIREFKISSKGLYFGPPLVDFSGIFRGVPSYFGAKPILSDKENK